MIALSANDDKRIIYIYIYIYIYIKILDKMQRQLKSLYVLKLY